MTTTWRYVPTRDRVSGEDVYAIRELYTDDETGALSWTKNPIEANGETVGELIADLGAMYTAAMHSEVLDLTLDPPALVKRAGL